jgi:hypothetical protein
MLFETALAGEWEFALDPDGRGEREAWFKAALPDTITLPGSVDEAAKTPLTTGRTMAHLSRRHPYVGRAWYARTFEVGAEADGLFHHLSLERVHGELNVWVDGFKLGRDDSLSTANRMLIGKLAAGPHRVVLMIDNGRFEAVGDAIARYNPMHADVAHSTTDHTQTNWNGVVGHVRVEASRASIARVDVFAPDRSVRVRIELDAFDPNVRFPTYWTEPHDDELELRFELAGIPDPVVVSRRLKIDSAFTALEIALELPAEAGLWDEFDPLVHRLVATWRRDGVPQDRRELSFGIRSFVRDGKRIRLNGRPVFLRGTLDCCIFPLTGYPPTDQAGWRKVFETARAYGLNHIRYHSYCPPRAAFEVADEMGMLLHVETPVWAVLGGDPNLDRFIHAEAERIIRDYGNHPSFVMLCVGNEVHGDGLHAFLERFIDKWQARDRRRIYSGGSGWPTTQRADYASKPEPRNQRWLEGLAGRLNARPLETLTDWSDHLAKEPVPLLSHETGQWCVFPNLEERAKYTGVLEARNFEMVHDDLLAKGLEHLARDYFLNSGVLQAQLYKEELEAALRTRDFLGTQLLGLQDFSGQGTALVGVVDAFWDPKPYVTAEAFREFCAPVVPLVRAKGFVLEAGEVFSCDLQLANFGPLDLVAPTLAWTLLAGPEIVASGALTVGKLATGGLHDIGRIEIDTAALAAPRRYELVVALEGTQYRNRWGLWVMPSEPDGGALTIVGELDQAVLDRVAAGETIIFAPAPQTIRPNAALGHTAAFWNTLWTNGQEPHTLGLLNDTDHPIFAAFPADRHSDWHWWELTFRRRALDIAGLELGAIVRVIDDWNANRDLVLLAEARLGAGRLIVSAIDMEADLERRPVARSFRRAVAAYAASRGQGGPMVTAAQLEEWWGRIKA